jgi:hypothetical protein
MRRSILFLTLAVLSGCIRGNYLEGSAVPWERVQRIQPGVTTKAEVLAWLGAPLNFSIPTALDEFLEDQGLEGGGAPPYPFADVFAYQLSRGKLRGFTVILYTRINLELDSDLLVIFFGEDWKVIYMGVRRAEDADDAQD